MKLPPLNLEALYQASLQATNRQLTRYLLDTFGHALPRLHGHAEHVHPLVTMTGQLLRRNGLTSGREYSLLILTHFLLGLGWWGDPASKYLWSINNADGLTQDERLDLLVEQVVTHRRRLEAQLPRMHDNVLTMLGWGNDIQDDSQRWQSLSQLMTLRGIPRDAHQDSYCQYALDACERYALPPLRYQLPNGSQTLAYRHTGQRMPQPSDELKSLLPLPRNQVLLHVVLAIAFGRYFYLNPLFSTWVALLEQPDTPRERCHVLAEQLTAHQRALKDVHTHD